MTTNPVLDAFAAFDSFSLPSWATADTQHAGDIPVDVHAPAPGLELPDWTYTTLDPSLWPASTRELPTLDYGASMSSNTDHDSLGTPPSASSLPLSLPSPSPPVVFPVTSSTALPSPTLASNTSPSSSTSPIFSAEACWAAVLSRDPTTTCLFVYSVHSTGIYCRPTCPARRPLRSNVTFYSTGAEAEAAGFRACLRCKPGDEQDPSEKRQAEAVECAKRVIKERVEQGGKMGLKELGEKTGMSVFHLQRVFKKRVGVTPEGYAKRMREDMRWTKGTARGQVGK